MSILQGDEPGIITAVIAPSNNQASRRTEQLPQDCIDLLAHAFDVCTIGPLGMPLCAVEIRLDDPMTHLFGHGEGIKLHAGCDSLRYFHHADDPNWALIFAHDCPGDPSRGKEILDRHRSGHSK